jgi:hypothetical protein
MKNYILSLRSVPTLTTTMKTLTLICLTAIGATPVLACDLCSVYSGGQAYGEIGKGIYAGVAEQFTYFGTLQENGVKVANPVGQYLNSSVSQLFAGYNFSERVGVQFTLPVIYRSYRRPEGFAVENGTESGIGDVSLAGHVQAVHLENGQSTFIWNLLGGVKFPTGSSDRIAEEFNETEVPGAPESGIHGHDLALGSGSYDGIVGTEIYARWQRWYLRAGTQYTIRSTGDFDYRYANDLTWSGGPGYYFLMTERHSLALQLAVAGETKGYDTFQGATAADTGVTSVFLGPLINFTWSDKFNAEAGVDLPVLINNTALQLVPDYRVRAALVWHF